MLSCRLALAVPIASHSTADSTNVGFWGQSFTVTGGGAFNNIIFNFFFDTGLTTPQAQGTAYLFAAPFTGIPVDLSGASGILGQTAASGGFYVFNPALTLTSGVQYFLYTNTSFLAALQSTDGYPDGDLYLPPWSAFGASSQDAAFLVQGSAVPAGVPEFNAQIGGPLLVTLCLLGLVASRRIIHPSRQ
jgi:hypothetical protein